jgi:hypothetical protein
MQDDTFTLNPTGATTIGMNGSEETEKSLKDHQECKRIKQLRNSEKSKTEKANQLGCVLHISHKHVT